jgi:hypothetical protein
MDSIECSEEEDELSSLDEEAEADREQIKETKE